jgi:hypothetical protein
VTGSRLRSRRLGAILTAATTIALLGAMLVAGGATAKSNRVVCLSSSAGFGLAAGTCSSVNTRTGAITPGTLKNTPVNPGGKTATMVIVRNDDNQTLNHVTLAGGDVADNLPYNAIGPKPATTSLNGMTLATVIPQDGSNCGTPTTTGFLCEIGTLGPGQSASFLIVINAPGTAGSTAWWVTADWNEGWSTTGTNADYTFATGSVDVSNASCTDGSANYFVAGDNVNVDNGGANCGNQNGNIKSLDVLSGNGGFASLKVDGNFAVPCPQAYKNKCYGKTVTASVLGGNPVPGGAQWTIKWFGINHLTGVFHFGDSYPTNSNDYVAIPLTTANKCTTTKVTDCWSNVVTTNTPKTITVTFVTEDNGKGAGW